MIRSSRSPRDWERPESGCGVTVTERELDLLRRGLHRLLGEVSPNESAHGLVARLALAAAELETSAGRALAHPVEAESRINRT